MQDISKKQQISELIKARMHTLPARAQNVLEYLITCDDLTLIECIYDSNELKNIRNVGKKTKSELEEFIDKLWESPEVISILTSEGDKNKILNFNSEIKPQFLENNKGKIIGFINTLKIRLSNRNNNVIDQLLADDLSKIMPYVFENKSITTLDNVGEKSAKELELFFKDIRKGIQANNGEVLLNFNEPSYIDIFSLESRGIINENKDLIIDFTESLLEELSVRGRNAINEMLNSDFNDFISYVSGAKSPKSIRNIGITTIPEIKETLKRIRYFIKQLQSTNSEESFFKLRFESFFMANHEVSEIINQASSQILQHRLHLFSFYKSLILSGYFLNGRELKIFLKYKGLFNNSIHTLNDLALELKITRERVRQINTKLFKKIDSSNSYIVSQLPELLKFANYDFLNEKELLIIDEELVHEINEKENLNLNLFEAAFLASLILRGKFIQIISPQQDDSFFLFIETSLNNLFDFQNFIQDFTKLNSLRRKTKYELNFEGFLIKYLMDKTYSNLQKIKYVCESIIFLKFNKIISFEGNIVFEPIKINLLEEIKNILKQFNKPMTVEEITFALHKKLQNEVINASQVRVQLQRSNELNYIGRSSTYFLAEWETKRKNLKGGTIRDIVIEQLEKSSGPLHIDEIVTYVSRYRDTNKNSILSNLKLDTRKRFKFYKGGFISV